jgi:D-sedoheptulose 7-phosphate isomerase
MNDRVAQLILRYPALKPCASSIDETIDLWVAQFRAHHKLLLAGNGGSAADSDHISGELLKGFAKRRKLSPADSQHLGEHIAEKLQGGLPAIPLSQFSSLLTAYGNDCDAQYGFAQLVWALGQPGDVLFAISTSGNSKNILHASHVARQKGMKVVALTGAGGALKSFADISICAPSVVTYEIQEFHLPIYHCLCLAVEDVLFPDSTQLPIR